MVCVDPRKLLEDQGIQTFWPMYPNVGVSEGHKRDVLHLPESQRGRSGGNESSGLLFVFFFFFSEVLL